MNDQKTAILMDSCGDLPPRLRKEEGIYTLPVHILYPEGDYLDGVSIRANTIYERFPAEIPTTSTPSPQEAIDMLEQIRSDGYEKVIAICISNRLSGVGNTIRIASVQVDGLTCFVFDTLNIDIGSGIFAYWAARKLKEGLSFEELCELLPLKRKDSHLMFYMDTLKYLAKGGRIGKVSYVIGEMLHVKPIISCDEEGVYYTVAKIRGEKHAKKKLLTEMVKRVGDNPCWIVVGHGDAAEEAHLFLRMVKAALPQGEILFAQQIVPSMAIHTGPGLIGLGIFVDP